MGNEKNKLSKVKPIFAYFKDSIKFYDLDNSAIAQIVFVLILAILFGGNIIARPYTEKFLLHYEQFGIQLAEYDLNTLDLSMVDAELLYNMTNAILASMGILLLVKAISYLVALFYGSYYFYSITRPETTLALRISMFFQKLPKLIGFNLLFYFIFALALFVFLLVFLVIGLIVPGIIFVIAPFIPIIIVIVDLLFIFKNLLIIEFDVGVLKNFKKSLDIIKGNKVRIVNNGLFPHILTLILSAIATNNNPMLSLFIVAFFEVIILLFSNRLTTLMFIDVASLKPDNKNLEEVSDSK